MRTRINNLEEFIEFAKKYVHLKIRYRLSRYKSKEFVDKKAGKEWVEERREVYKNIRYGNKSSHNSVENINARRPEMKPYMKYDLEEQGGTIWHQSDTLALSEDIGEMVYDIWTKKPGKGMVGGLTLLGMFKRLDGEIYNLLRECVKREQKKRDETARIYNFNRINKLSNSLLDVIERECKHLGFDGAMTLNELIYATSLKENEDG